MKNFTLVTVLSGILLLSIITTSCKKTEQEGNKPLTTIAGRWGINRIQLKIYYGGVFFKDSIIPRAPQKENFVRFDDPTKAFQYRFNAAVTDIGTYTLKGEDSIIATASKIYNWKMLTLTDVLFTARNTNNNDLSFPGATVETYYTFTR
jgi:hypothetical protein